MLREQRPAIKHMQFQLLSDARKNNASTYFGPAVLPTPTPRRRCAMDFFLISRFGFDVMLGVCDYTNAGSVALFPFA